MWNGGGWRWGVRCLTRITEYRQELRTDTSVVFVSVSSTHDALHLRVSPSGAWLPVTVRRIRTSSSFIQSQPSNETSSFLGLARTQTQIEILDGNCSTTAIAIAARTPPYTRLRPACVKFLPPKPSRHPDQNQNATFALPCLILSYPTLPCPALPRPCHARPYLATQSRAAPLVE